MYQIIRDRVINISCTIQYKFDCLKERLITVQPFQKTLHVFNMPKIIRFRKIHKNSWKRKKKKTLHTTTTFVFSDTNHTHSFNLYSTMFIMWPKARKKTQTETHGGDGCLSDNDITQGAKGPADGDPVGYANRCMHMWDIPAGLGSSASPEMCEPSSHHCSLYSENIC